MSKVVGDVAIKVGADTTSLVLGMRKSEKSMANFAKVGAASAAAVGVAMVALTKRSLANIDAMAKQARSVGLTTDAFQKMSLVAGEAGVDTGKLTASLGILQRNIVEAAKGTKTQEDAFKALGLSLVDLEGKTPDDQFEKLADALDLVTDPAQRTALAMDTLGRGGRDMINMLGGYSAKAQEAALFQQKFGIAVRQSASNDIEAANDAVGRLGLVMEGLGNRMAQNTAPAIEGIANAMLGFMEKVIGARTSLEEFFGTLEAAQESLGEGVFNRLVGRPDAIFQVVPELEALEASVSRMAARAEVAQYSMGAFSDSLERTGDMAGVAAADAMRRLTGELEAVSKEFYSGEIEGEDFRLKIVSITTRAGDLVASLGDVDNATFANVRNQLATLAKSALDAASAALALRQASGAGPGMTTGTPLYEQEEPVGGWGVQSPLAPTTSIRPKGPTVDSYGNFLAANEPSGGGGGGVDPRAARLESLVESLKTEQETIAEWYAVSLEMLNTASDAELDAIGGKHAAMERLEQEHQDRLGRIREIGNKWGVDAAVEGGGAILKALASTNKKAAKAQGVYAAGVAWVSTLTGAAKELEKGTFGFASAAAVIAKGAGFVSAIQSAASSASSGSSSGSSGSSASGAAAAAPVERRVAEFQFVGGNVLDPAAIVDAMNEAYDQGYQIKGILA